MVNVTKENFIEQSNDLLQHLPQAVFVAIDEEMTGISTSRETRPSKDWTPAQRYPDVKQAPERYAIVQLGVALYFHRDEEKDESTIEAETGRGYASPTTSSNAAAPYSVRRYNFYLFPDPDARDVVLNPATVAFLHQHGMRLDLWSRAGIPYTTTEHAEERLAFYQRQEVAQRRRQVSQEQDRPVSVPETVRHRIALTRTEDKTFHARAMAGLREWLDSPIPPPDAPPPPHEEGAILEPPDPLLHCSFLLPPCNSFLRRSLYESIQKEYPALELEHGGNQQIRVWRLNEAEKAERHRRLRQEGWEALLGQKLGLWRVFEALRRVCSGLPLDPTSVLFASSYEQIDWDRILAQSEPEEDIAAGRQMPLVVHNGFMDLCFLMTHFVSPQLPERYSECKRLISQHFPNIYDTKILATECPCWDGEANESTASSTNLSNLFQLVVCDPHMYEPMTTTTERRYNILRDAIVVLPPLGSAVNVVADQEHEAAFDAYMTGAIFIGLCLRIAARTPQLPKDRTYLSIIGNEEYRDLARAYFGRNKLYQMSIYTMDLEETRPDRDPLSKGMLSESTFRVAGIDKAVATRDIVQCLSGLRDAQGRVVNFVIVWVDDTTFLVAASYHPARPVWNEGATEDAPDVAPQPSGKNDPIEVVLREHGVLLLEALRARFNKSETIVVLEDYLASLSEMGATSRSTLAGPPKKSWFQRIWSLFGAKNEENQKRPSDETTAPSNKRRRVT